jgi:hypothetical protein
MMESISCDHLHQEESNMMRSLAFALFIMILGSCSVSSQVNKPKRSFIGGYNPLNEKGKGMFTVSLDYKGYRETHWNNSNSSVYFRDTVAQHGDTMVFPPQQRFLPNQLPWVEITFKNPTDSSIVIEFPFNWHERFIKNPIYFEFDHNISENERAELFYPDRKDTANNFIRSPQYVYLSPNESLSFGVFIYNPILESKSEKELTFSLWFRYIALRKARKITSDKNNEFIQYKTKPITVLTK